MLKYRVPAGLLLTIVFVMCLVFDSKYHSSLFLSSFFAVGVAIVLREFYAMAEAKGMKPMVIYGLIMGVCLVFAHDRWCWEKWHNAARSVPDLMSTVVALCVVGTCALQGTRKSPDGAIMNIGVTLFGWIYVWFLPAFLVKIRHLGLADAKGWNYDGTELVAMTLMVAKVSDIGGFFAGRAFGKHKMSPIISPKKTWEGAAGGIALSVAFALLVRTFYPGSILQAFSFSTVILFGIVMALSSLLGDLLASCIKRDCNVKDSGAVVPGFGGLLDVVDSLMIASPIAYYFFLLAGARPGLEI